MALTKLPQNAFGTGSVDSDKIEDGTVQGVDISGSIANDRLVNSSITFSGSSTALGGSATLAGYLDWQSVITADGSTTTTAVAGEGYIIDTTSASHTINLPASASIGDTIGIKDYAGTFGTNALVIGRNGHNIQGVANNSQLGTNRASVVLVYVDSTKGWLYTNEHNVGDLVKPLFIEATGGTTTTSGDYKIHTFTGDGCFSVSQIGNSPIIPTGGPNTIDYLVVAGAGGAGRSEPGTAGSGGGGAGGMRFSSSTYCGPGSAGSALTASVTTYPITVGGGGGAADDGIPGSNSIFSTITSTGGGGGIRSTGGGAGENCGLPGGSGGGASRAAPAGGTGNTPPVSPPQGNPGSGAAPDYGGGGGGHGGSASQGAGGSGTSITITGSPVTYSAGGKGGGTHPTANAGDPTPGSANTGNGAWGGNTTDNPPGVGAAGGKGIVIVRYKYQ